MIENQQLEARPILEGAYRDFNARRLDAVLARMKPDVIWPNGMEGGFVHGHEGVRANWTRQWTEVDPHVEPLNITLYDDGRFVVEVHQVVRDMAGNLLLDTIVHHAYRIDNGLIERMDIE
jgi:hypothetical protein